MCSNSVIGDSALNLYIHLLSSQLSDYSFINRGRSLGVLNEDYLRAEPVFDESADEFGANSSIQDGVQTGGILGEVSSKSLKGKI